MPTPTPDQLAEAVELLPWIPQDDDGLHYRQQQIAQALADAHEAGQTAAAGAQLDNAAIVLDRADASRLLKLFGAMPYAAGLSYRAPGLGRITAESLLTALDELRGRLVGLGKRQHATETELHNLRAQRDAAREYLGAGLLGLLALAKTDAPNPLEVAHRAQGPDPEGLELLGTAEESARWQLDPVEQVKHHATALAAYLHPDDEEAARAEIAAAVRRYELRQQPAPEV